MRRRKLLVALVGLAVVVAAGAVVLWPQAAPPSRVTRENYDCIQEGMTRAEVEAILGPPGDYRTGLGESVLGEADYGITQIMVWMPDPATDPAPTLWSWRKPPGQWTGARSRGQAGWATRFGFPSKLTNRGASLTS
jgi:hypothetical protein